MAIETAETLRQRVANLASQEEHSTDASKYWIEVLPANWRGPYPKHWCGAFALWSLRRVLGCVLTWEIATATKRESGFLHHLPILGRGIEPDLGDIAYLDAPFQHHAVVTAAGLNAAGSAFVITQDGNSGDPPGEVAEHWNLRAHWTCFYSIQGLVDAALQGRPLT